MSWERERLRRIRHALRRRGFDALLVSRQENRFYLSGFSAPDAAQDESSGALLVRASGAPILFTDSRFELQALEESKESGAELMIYQRGLLTLLDGLLPRLALRRLAFEGRAILYADALALVALCRKHGVETDPKDGMVERLRLVKDLQETKKITAALAVAEQALQEVLACLSPGIRERDVALALDTAMRRLGADGPSFPIIVASGPNGAMPHALAGDRAIQESEPVVIDMGAHLDGYCSDISRTIVLGTADQTTLQRIRAVRRAQLAAIAAIRPGVAASEPDLAARKVLAQEGLDEFFTHSLGHGVGLAVHEAPSLNRRNQRLLVPGMVVTVEPGVYFPGWGGIRLENLVRVSADGCELLNRDTSFLDL